MLQYLKLMLEFPVLIAAIFVAGIGGTFQTGLAVSVMTAPSAFIKELVNQTCLHRYNVSLEQTQVSLIWSFIVSIYAIGGFLGSLVAGPLITKCGRKRCLLLNNFVAITGAVLMLLSQTAMSFEMIMAGRLLHGINSGVGYSAHAMYVVECAPKRLRGMVGVTIFTFIALGKFCGQLLGIRELLGTPERWTWLLGSTGFIALLQLFTLPFLPESPRFLLLDRRDEEAGKKALSRLWGNKDYSAEVEEMLQEKTAFLQSIRSHSVIELIKDQTLRWQLLTIIVTFSALQLCGINAVYFYSFDVFRASGIQEHQISYTVLGTGLCEFCTSIFSLMMVEITGNKVLLLQGYIGMSVTLILLTITQYLQSQVFWMSYCSMALIFIFISFFASGPAAVTAPIAGEILTQSFRSAGYIVASAINWTCLFVVGILFPLMVEKLSHFCFLIFVFFCGGCGLYVRLCVPETKNRTVLEITAEFQKMHCRITDCEQTLQMRRISS